MKDDSCIATCEIIDEASLIINQQSRE